MLSASNLRRDEPHEAAAEFWHLPQAPADHARGVDMNVRMLRQNAALDDMSSMDPKKQKPLLRAIVAEYKWVYLDRKSVV